MENSTTVRIDLQRLQILNDRLCQTLEALNQVRMSAHSANTTYGWTPNHFGHGYPQAQFWGAPVAQGFNGYPMMNNSYGYSYNYGMNTPVSPWNTSFNGVNTGFGSYGVAPTMSRPMTAFAAAQPVCW